MCSIVVRCKDGSDVSVRAIRAGLALLDREGKERLIDMGLSRVRGVADTVGLGEEHLEVLVGQPAETVLEYLKDQDAKLVVLGTRGLGGAARLFLGSVSDHLLREAPCPTPTGCCWTATMPPRR